MNRRKQWVGAAILLGAVACQDLAVTNPNEPDRERATKQPVSAESFVSSSFRSWWPVAGHDDYPSWAFSTMANEVTSGFADFGQLELSAEPRQAWNNSPVNARNQVSEGPWYGLYRTISSVNDALIGRAHRDRLGAGGRGPAAHLAHAGGRQVHAGHLA
jgi:starch-binding outer membrane protein, SusD/RagB family